MSRLRSVVSLRSILLILLFIGFTLLVVTRFANLRQLANRLVQGNVLWISLAILLHITYFYLYAILYYFCFSMVGVKLPTLGLFPALLAALFVNAVAPTGGVGGAAVMVNYASRKGNQGSRAAVGVLLTLIADLLMLTPFILAGIFYLLSQSHLRFYEWVAFLLYLFFIGGLSILLILAHFKPDLVRRLFEWVRRQVNRFGRLIKRPEILAEGWVEENAEEFIDGSNSIARAPRTLAITLTWSLFMHGVNLMGLYLFFRAYGQTVNFGTIDAAFSLGTVFFVIAIIPQGVGAVEGIMGLIMVDMGMSRTDAAVIALSFRGVNFWLPVLAGLVSYQFLFARSGHNSADESPGNKQPPDSKNHTDEGL